MLKIHNLSNVSPGDLFAAFNKAFADYDRQWNEQEFNKMLVRRGYDATLSFGAFDKSDLVSFTLNGIGVFDSKRTAYDTGTGTIPSHRGQGLVQKIFEESLPYLREAGITHYLLEVLQHNSKAISIYQQLGFKSRREFNYFFCDRKEISVQSGKMSDQIMIRQTDLHPDSMMPMWDVEPSWQNGFESISRKKNDFIILGAFLGKELIGYGIIEPSSGDISQFAVKKEFRRQGIGTTLLHELLSFNQASIIKVVNADAADPSIVSFLAFHNIHVTGKQWEMIMEINVYGNG